MKPGTVRPWGQDQVQFWLHPCDARAIGWVIVSDRFELEEERNLFAMLKRTYNPPSPRPRNKSAQIARSFMFKTPLRRPLP